MSPEDVDEPQGESGSEATSEPRAPERTGTNASEAGVLWAIAEHGGDVELLDGAEPGPARGIVDHVEDIESMGSEERSEVADVWAERDRVADDCRERIAEWPESKVSRFVGRLSGPWRRVVRSWMSGGERFPWVASEEMSSGLAGLIAAEVDDRDPGLRDELLDDAPYTYDSLLELSPREFEAFLPKLGTYQVAELLRGQNRRRLARVMRKLSEFLQQLLIDCLNRARDLERVEQVRIREVFVTISKYYDDFEQRVTQLGLYSVACAAGYRYRDRVEELASRVGRKCERRLRRYYRLTYSSTRRGVGKEFRASLTEFLEWMDERESAQTEGDDDQDG